MLGRSFKALRSQSKEVVKVLTMRGKTHLIHFGAHADVCAATFCGQVIVSQWRDR